MSAVRAVPPLPQCARRPAAVKRPAGRHVASAQRRWTDYRQRVESDLSDGGTETPAGMVIALSLTVFVEFL